MHQRGRAPTAPPRREAPGRARGRRCALRHQPAGLPEEGAEPERPGVAGPPHHPAGHQCDQEQYSGPPDRRRRRLPPRAEQQLGREDRLAHRARGMAVGPDHLRRADGQEGHDSVHRATVLHSRNPTPAAWSNARPAARASPRRPHRDGRGAALRRTASPPPRARDCGGGLERPGIVERIPSSGGGAPGWTSALRTFRRAAVAGR